MYARSELRHACFRAKKGVATEQNRLLLDVIQPLLQPHQRWENFNKVWDILVNKSGEIKIIKPEVNYDYIHSTLLEASLYSKQGIDFDSFDDNQMNIIAQVEILMLDNIMNWNNYNKVWGVEVDPELKTLKTKLYNVDPRQIEVTQEMIEASKKDADGNPLSASPKPVELEMKPMSAAESRSFEKFLATKYPQ
jgi:hypothetical protein